MFQLRTPTVSRALHPLLSDLLNTTLEIDPRISDAFLSHQAQHRPALAAAVARVV